MRAYLEAQCRYRGETVAKTGGLEQVHLKTISVAVSGALLLAIALGTSMSSASAQSYGSALSLLTARQTDADLDVESRTFEAPLPDGVDWPSKLPADLADSGPDVSFESGFAETLLAQYWLCAWEVELLGSTPGSDSYVRALSWVNRFITLDVYEAHFVDPTNRWYRDVVAPALVGDLSGVSKDITESCGYYGENNA